MKLEFLFACGWCMVLFFVVNADEFKPVQVSSRIEQHVIRRDINTSIVMSTYTADTWMDCLGKCSADLSNSLYYVAANRTCQCNNGVDVSTEDDPGKPEVVYGYFEELNQISMYKDVTKLATIPRPSDCLDVYNAGYPVDGVYTIQPAGQPPVDTWCDIQNGGWTVIQRRMDGSENFYRGWSDYVAGFGNRTGEYWLGLDNIHALTSTASELHVYGEAFEGDSPQSGYAQYSTFTVEEPSHNYRLHVTGYNGTCGDMFAVQGNGMVFSTFDRDQDLDGGNCAVDYKGAWWYGHCHEANLNGHYYGGHHGSYADGVNWYACWGFQYSLKKTVMKLRKTATS